MIVWENTTPSTELPRDFLCRDRPAAARRCACFLETVLFYFQTNRERKIDNEKFGRKKGFLSFYSVCMFV